MDESGNTCTCKNDGRLRQMTFGGVFDEKCTLGNGSAGINVFYLIVSLSDVLKKKTFAIEVVK